MLKLLKRAGWTVWSVNRSSYWPYRVTWYLTHPNGRSLSISAPESEDVESLSYCVSARLDDSKRITS